jgi:hypothetical protein
LGVAVRVAYCGSLDFRDCGQVLAHPVFGASRFGLLAAYFGLTAVGLFSYLRNADFITNSHLYTAISIYLLLGFVWFGLCGSINTPVPKVPAAASLVK